MKFRKIDSRWVFHTALTVISFALFLVFVAVKWGPAFYATNVFLQKFVKQVKHQSIFFGGGTN
jgi:hypothetical protein